MGLPVALHGQLRHPAIEALGAPLRRYAEAWWLAVVASDQREQQLSVKELGHAFTHAEADCRATRSWVQIRHSPVALAIFAARTVTWVWVSPNGLDLGRAS